MHASWRQSQYHKLPRMGNHRENTIVFKQEQYQSGYESWTDLVKLPWKVCKLINAAGRGERGGWKLPIHELSSDISPSGVKRGTLSWGESPNQAHLYSGEHSVGIHCTLSTGVLCHAWANSVIVRLRKLSCTSLVLRCASNQPAAMDHWRPLLVRP